MAKSLGQGDIFQDYLVFDQPTLLPYEYADAVSHRNHTSFESFGGFGRVVKLGVHVAGASGRIGRVDGIVDPQVDLLSTQVRDTLMFFFILRSDAFAVRFFSPSLNICSRPTGISDRL